ncbi:MAG: hypothetical protein WC438_03170 [Candidatus Pacearchaeota archaeon]
MSPEYKTPKDITLRKKLKEEQDDGLEMVLFPLVEGLGSFFKYLYGSVSGMFKMPTSIRRIVNKQTILNDSDSNEIDSMLGSDLGIMIDIGFLAYSAYQVGAHSNYLPLEILGATNALSLVYELGRFSKSK